MELANNPLFDATRLDLASFESYMLFPDSEEDRRQAYNASFIEYSIQNPSIVGDEHLAELLYISSKTLPIFAIQERVNERFIHGMIIGEVLQRQIELNCIGDMSVTKGELIRDAVKKFNKTKDGGFLRISPKTINTYIWPRFHSVAHFWAACVAANILNDNPNGALPLSPRRAPEISCGRRGLSDQGGSHSPKAGEWHDIEFGRDIAVATMASRNAK